MMYIHMYAHHTIESSTHVQCVQCEAGYTYYIDLTIELGLVCTQRYTCWYVHSADTLTYT